MPGCPSPTPLRFTGRHGHVIAVVVNDRGDTRSYRTDRMAGSQVTDEPFVPKYLVEF